MDSLQVPRPAWMTEDLVLLEEQASRFLAAELVPHIEKWTVDGIMERVLPESAAHLKRITTGADTMMELPAEAF